MVWLVPVTGAYKARVAEFVVVTDVFVAANVWALNELKANKAFVPDIAVVLSVYVEATVDKYLPPPRPSTDPVTSPCRIILGELISVPTYNFLAIPAPPADIKDPVETLEESVVPSIFNEVPTYTFLATPRPPAVLTDPVVMLEESVVEAISKDTAMFAVSTFNTPLVTSSPISIFIIGCNRYTSKWNQSGIAMWVIIYTTTDKSSGGMAFNKWEVEGVIEEPGTGIQRKKYYSQIMNVPNSVSWDDAGDLMLNFTPKDINGDIITKTHVEDKGVLGLFIVAQGSPKFGWTLANWGLKAATADHFLFHPLVLYIPIFRISLLYIINI